MSCGAEEADQLRAALKGAPAEVVCGDGYDWPRPRAKPGQRLFVLIDPPFERPDDYARSAEAARAIVRRNPGAVVVIWLPLKDLETFDGFLRRLEAGPRAQGPGGRDPASPARRSHADERLRPGGRQSARGAGARGRRRGRLGGAGCGETGSEARVWRLDAG